MVHMLLTLRNINTVLTNARVSSQLLSKSRSTNLQEMQRNVHKLEEIRKKTKEMFILYFNKLTILLLQTFLNLTKYYNFKVYTVYAMFYCL